MTQQTSTEVTLPSEQPQPPTLREQVTRMEHQFALAAPKGIEARQIVRDVLTAISQNPKLAECEPTSVLGAAMTMAQLGLRVGVLGHGWILPFWNARERRFDAQLVIGYLGYVELAHRSGQIKSISARTVHANDHFEIEYGIDEKLIHRPAAGDRGIPIGYYAVCRTTTGGQSFHYMTTVEVEKHRDRYAMAKKKDGTVVGPWKSEFDAMAKKTCVRQLAKFMPRNTDLATAMSVDESVRIDLSPTTDPAHVSRHIEPPVAAETVSVAQETQTKPEPTEEEKAEAEDFWKGGDAS